MASKRYVTLRSVANNLIVSMWDRYAVPDGREICPLQPIRETAGIGEVFEIVECDEHGYPLPEPPPPDPTPVPPPTDEPWPLNLFALDSTRVIGSDPACLRFPQSASLDQFSIYPEGISLYVSGAESWPPVSIDDGDPSQTATLWVFEYIHAEWCATGAERLRPGQILGDVKPEQPPSTMIGNGWLYDPGRWGQMAGYNPAPGEIVGFCVIAGSTRSDNQTPVDARTEVCFFRWPSNAGSDPVDVIARY